MLGAVPNAVGLLGYAALGPYAQQGSAVSTEAASVGRAAIRLVRAAEQSVALFGERAAAISRLHELANECAQDNWDGAGAVPMDLAAVARAETFLRALPHGTPLPECSPEPDGSVSLDWCSARNRLFSVSVGRSNRLAFAWLDGNDKGHGVARFDGLVIPARVLLGLSSIWGPTHAPVWPA